MKNKINVALTIVAIIIIALLMVSPVSRAEVQVINPPDGMGNVHTYTKWDKIKWGYDCKNLINFMGNDNISDTYGIVKYGDFWAGALTSTFGKVGDMLLVIQNDNSVYPIIIADTKHQGDTGCNKYGHHYGKCIVEFEILSSCKNSLYGKNGGGYISDKINKPIKQVINLDSVYDDNKYLNNVVQACLDNALEGCNRLISPYEYEEIRPSEPVVEDITESIIYQPKNKYNLTMTMEANPFVSVNLWRIKWANM